MLTYLSWKFLLLSEHFLCCAGGPAVYHSCKNNNQSSLPCSLRRRQSHSGQTLCSVSFPTPHHCTDDFPHSIIFRLHLHSIFLWICFKLIPSPRWVWAPPFGIVHNAVSHLLVVGFFGTSSAQRQWGEWLRWWPCWWIVFGGWGCGAGCHLVHWQGFCFWHEFNGVGEAIVGLEGLLKGGLSPSWGSSRHHIIIPCWCLL